ncbi:FGGY-family carbohydrate kinase [Microbacterium sp. C23T]
MVDGRIAQDAAALSSPGCIGERSLFAGIDLGSTNLKMLVTDSAGNEIVSDQVPTPWRLGAGGTTELDAHSLAAAIDVLLRRVCSALAALTAARIEAIGVAGMGETGMVVDRAGTAVAPAFAWFDPRGAAQLDSFSPAVRDEFAGRTGLPFGVQVTAVKLAYVRDQGVMLRGRRWLNLPEFVVTLLGGETAVEYSLTSRTGLIDQDTGEPWGNILHDLGVDETFLPPLRDAGAGWGRVSPNLPDNIAGAHLTVAGHDHLVSAEATSTLDSDTYHVSLGTAEVLLRVIDRPLGFEARRRLADALINEVRHVVPGKHVLVAGVKSGLLLRRVLQLSGITDRTGRDALDDQVMASPYEGALPDGALEVTGARNDDGVLRITSRTDGISPAELFSAVLRHSNEEIQTLIAAMDREVPPATSSTLTGGWTGMSSVRRARSRVLPDLAFSSQELETAFGAATVAARTIRPN